MPKILEPPPKRDPNAPPPTDEEIARAFVWAISELMAPRDMAQQETAPSASEDAEVDIEIVIDHDDEATPKETIADA